MTSRKRARLSDSSYEFQNEGIKFKLVDNTAFTPYRATDGSAGYDLTLVKDTIFPSKSTKVINYKVCLQLPKNILAKLETRSSIAKLGLMHLGGCIDSDYRGPIQGLVHNLTESDVYLKRGNRLGQLIFTPVVTPDLISADILTGTERGCAGIGSTGRLHESYKYDADMDCVN